MNQEDDASQNAQGGLEEKKKNKGLVSGLFMQIATTTGIVEQTRLSPEFIREIDKYLKYQNVADGLVGRLEACIQMNPKILASNAIEAKERADPYEILARSFKYFRHSLPEDKKTPLMAAEAIAKRLALIDREIQSKGRRSIRKMRRFVSNEYEIMLEEQKNLMTARDLMDSARHDLKKAGTSAEVEEKGKIYEMAVHEFDVQAEKLMVICEKLPQDKQAHQREVLDFFEVLARNHKTAVTVLADHLGRVGITAGKK